jgi:penicillin G amidase
MAAPSHSLPRKRGRVRVGRRIVAGLAALVLIASGGFYLYLLSALPQTGGRLVVTGPKAAVRIERDADGVPTISARSDDDAAFGLGFAHAQDRLFQMELMRRYAAGRLAEFFGPAALPVDKQMRVLGLYRAAAQEIPFLSAAVNRALAAYAAGVNAFLAVRRGALPPEFLLLHFSPQPWQPADSLAWGKLMALQIGGNYRGELLRASMARSISPADLAFLYPDYPKDGPTTLAAMLPIYRRLALGRLFNAMPPTVGPRYASNNWVVDGKRQRQAAPRQRSASRFRGTRPVVFGPPEDAGQRSCRRHRPRCPVRRDRP